ncbi:MAG: hypothetical protein KF774_21900, partial [Planctomyces sp.]|nr:hypothetical protein [Planctomyces sp.]
DEPTLPAHGMMQYCDKNPNSLHLSMGRLSEYEIQESHLSCRTGDARSLSTWRSTARLLRRQTGAGMIAAYPDTGHIGMARWQRYTPGAIAELRNGVRLIAISGAHMTPA